MSNKNSSSTTPSQPITPNANNRSSHGIDHLVERKLDKLTEAFIKCLEVSVGSINETDCQECFGDQRKSLGVQLQRTYINLLAEVEKRLETEELPRINQEFQIPSVLESLHLSQSQNNLDLSNIHANSSSSSVPSIEDPKKQLRPMIKAMKRAEIEELTNGTKFLEAEIKKSRDIAGRLRTQMLNEIEALNEENMKILHASNQAM